MTHFPIATSPLNHYSVAIEKEMDTMKKHTLEITNTEQLWWGGLVSDGIRMPYGKEDMIRDLELTNGENQAMPFLISQSGTYIWNEAPFAYKIREGMLLLQSKKPFVVDKSATSQKEGFLIARNKYFPGNQELPDELLFQKPQYNTWIEMMYDQTEDKILQYAKRIVEEGYPTGVIMIDDNWQEDYGVLEFHHGRFKDPKGMVDQLHALGFKVMLWVSPFISPDSYLFRELCEKDLLIKDSIGEVAIRKWWNGYSALLDCSNPHAREWFCDELNGLMQHYGVDGFKFDGGDSMFYREEDCIYEPCGRQDQSRYYAMVGLSFPLNEYRTSWKMAGLPLVQRLCDKDHSWGSNGLASLIPNAIAQGLMGYAYVCPDMIGGGQFKNFLEGACDLDEELVVRYAQCSALFPMMQFSVAPWRVLNEKNAELCKEAAKLHEQYGNYILNLAKESTVTGLPILRSLCFEFGEEYASIKDEFMLGDKILVAPVLEKNQYERTVVFPPGCWKDSDEQIVEGPCTKIVKAPIEKLPYYELCTAYH